jgi:hypothetical protein
MVTMVYGPGGASECDVFPSLSCTPKREQCQAFCLRQGLPVAERAPIGYRLYVGPRSFHSWDNAIAYAFLPPAAGHGSSRRRVARGSSGRWVVTQTFTWNGCPNPWHGSAPARAAQRCPECPR